MYTVSESNSSATSNIGGSVAPGSGAFSILGIARAGTSSSGVGQEIVGTYGSLILNADGSFSYKLDNNDSDTNVLGAGMSGTERFTYTYSLNGVVQTSVIEFQVNGVNETGQVATTLTTPHMVDQSYSIGAAEQLISSAKWGVLLSAEWGDVLHFTNNGALLINATDHEATAVAVYDGFHWTGSMVNNGLIDITGFGSAVGLSSAVEIPVINNGVIHINALGTSPNSYPGNATGMGAGHNSTLINNGMIDVRADYGNATGIFSNGIANQIENNGYLYVTGNTTTPNALVGIYCGQTDDVRLVNSGTIHVVATTGVATMGVYLFPDSTNAYQYATLINSGTIVATTAIYATAAYLTAVHVTNSGRIEGDFWAARNLNIVDNAAGGKWVGDLTFGFDQDVLLNSGSITGTVSLDAGDDYFDGRGGILTGSVDGGAGRDFLIGGAAADQLSGGADDDRIQGGGGADSLSGGSGGDIFVYSALTDSQQASYDLISGFESGIDKLDFSQLGGVSVQITQDGGYSLINVTAATGQMHVRVQGTVTVNDLIVLPAPEGATGNSGDDFLVAPIGNGTLSGNAGNDLLHAGAGNNILDGGLGADTMYGGAGNDVYYIDFDGDRVIELDGGGVDQVYSYIGYSLAPFAENLTLLGSDHVGALGNESDNVIIGNSGNNEIFGDDGDDIIYGGLGIDSLGGGKGADIFLYRAVNESSGAWIDRIGKLDRGLDKIDISELNPISFTFKPFVNYWSSTDTTTVDIVTADGTLTIAVNGVVDHSDFIMDWVPTTGTGAADLMTGTGSSDWLEGGDGADSLRGLAGSDTLKGGAGDDRLYGGDGSDVITGGAGADRFYFDAPIGGANVDRLVDIVAGEKIYLDTSIFSAIGVGTLAASAFNAATTSYSESHRIIYDEYAGQIWYDPDGTGSTAAILIAIVPAGTDLFASDFVGYAPGPITVYSDVSYVLGLDDANLVLTGSGPINGTGNSLANVITGNVAANLLNGLDGDDQLLGGSAADRLLGAAGNDLLDGGADADKLFGGTGDDIYIVDHGSDIVVEYAGEGTDTVRSLVSHTLRDNVENIELAGIYSIYANGNALNNVMTGNTGSNKLYGLGGNDVLVGLDGSDTLDGGVGADQMTGGGGNDQYYIDDAGDITIEGMDEGIDTVRTTIDVALAANIENLVLLGSASIGAAGNELNNVMTGNAGDNIFTGGAGVDQLKGLGGNDTLDGGVGSDRLYGGAGDDIYIVDTTGDLIFENAGEGIDSVYSAGTYILAANVEHLFLTGSGNTNGTGNDLANGIVGNTGANILYGQGGNDILQGMEGADVLKAGDGDDVVVGGAGRDRLYGEAGADQFTFWDGDFAGLSNSTCDQVHDFSQLQGDKIGLAGVDANTQLAGDQGFSFLGNGAFTGHAGELRTHQSGGNTYVSGDTDGDGVADFLIRLDGLHNLQSSDFII